MNVTGKICTTLVIFNKLANENNCPGLPDGLFSNPKSQFGQILEDLRLENVDIFYAELEYFTDDWGIL
jgi:hypothetical protein